MAEKASIAHKTAEIATQAHTAVLSENLVYLMGLSFIIGSLFTIFILIVLDFMKRDRVAK